MNRNFGKFLSLAVILVVIALTFTKLKREKPTENKREKREVDVNVKADDKEYMTYDDWSSGKFSSRSFYPNWISGYEYVEFSSGAIVKTNIDNGTKTNLLPNGIWAGYAGSAFGYLASPDEKYIAIYYERTTDGYAHYMTTFSVDVYVSGSSDNVFTTKNVQKFKWSPTGHKVSYVKEFDVYVRLDPGNVTQDDIQITNDGEENVIFNGITDWLHYVEITDDDALLWWSPDSKYLIYGKLDQDGVTNFDFSRFVGTQYPPMIKFPYPKPGTVIPKTTLYVSNTDGGNPEESTHFSPSTGVQDWGDYYLNSLMWRSNTDFVPTWKNRFENNSISDTCVATDGTSCSGSVDALKRSSATGWLGQYKPADLIRGQNDNELITMYSNENFPRVAVIDVATDTVTYRTVGNFEVTSISFYDAGGDWIYFVSTELESSTGEGLPRIRHLWKVLGHGADDTRTCITCQLNIEYKDRCNWVNPSFSTTGEYLVVNCGGTGNGIPISTSHKRGLNGNYDFVRVEEDNDSLNTTLSEYYYRERIYDTLTLDGVDGEWYYALHLPPNFDDSKSYPLFVQVYSGPGYQYVSDAYNADWARGYIASSDLDIVVMTFDGRGTGYRGDAIMHEVYRQLGKWEPIDQINAAKTVLDKYSYLDKSKVAVWGRSYGGYATTRIIESDEDVVFKCGIAVAPVIDWKFYHTIYTERYMGSPYGDNEDGYEESTALQKYDVIKKHKYYLVHGTSDENVHFQNSARMSMALIDHDVDFGAYFAADEVHSFNRGDNSYNHHYKYLTRKLKDCFGME